MACGASLEGSAPAVEERKVVSVLFADLVGFTARSDAADPEDVRAALRPYHARLKTEIERYGGTVEKFIGDAVMAVFGAPVAREDDAERAVRAALRIVEEIPVLNEEHPGLDLSVRVGVNTGEGLVNIAARADRGETLVTGDVVNTAARLQTVAPVGGVVVGEITYRATSEVFEYEALEPARLKGKADPVPLWQVLRARAGHRRGVEATDRTPFVGRELERTLLQQAFQRTVREGEAQLVTLTGEPGVGKSRLVHEFFRFIDDQPEIVSWRQGRCLPYGEGVSFWALGEIVKAQAGILESDAPEDAAAKSRDAVATLVDDPSEREWVEARVRSLVGASREVPASREELFAAWRRLFEAIAATHPLVLVFEDLHWADDALLAFIEHLVDWSAGVPLLVLCTARPELYERHSGWGGGKRNAVTIALSPLTSEESDALITGLLAGARLDPEVQATLRERAGGNPLFAEEFIRMFQETLTATGNETRAVSVPDSVHALIAARLDTLPAERKSILYDASVIGRIFWAGAVAHIAGTGENTVRTGLHELSRKELVRPVRTSSVKDQAEYSFWHALVRDVAYGQIPRAPRAQKHRAAAEWIEHLAGERIADHAEVLVHHYREAATLARAAGLDAEADEMVGKLRRSLVIAGQRMTQLDAPRSQGYFIEALELHTEDDADRRALLALAGEAALRRGDLEMADRFAAEGIKAFAEAGDEQGHASLLLLSSRVAWLRGDSSRHAAHLDQALETLERFPSSPDLALALTRKGFALWNHGDPRALEWYDRGLGLAESIGRRDLMVTALSTRGVTRVEIGDRDGVNDLEAAVSIGTELGDSRETQIALNNLADAVWISDRPARALECFRRSVEFGERRGLEQASAWSESEMTRVLYELGEWTELLERSDRLMAPDSRLKHSQGVIFAAANRAMVLAAQGNVAADAIEPFLERARSIGDLQVKIPALVAAMVVARRQNVPAKEIPLIEEFESATMHRPTDRGDLPAVVRVAIWAGRPDIAARLVEQTAGTVMRIELAVAGAHAEVEEATGDVRRAVRLHRDAAAAWLEFGNAVEHAHALFGEGRCLDAAKDPTAGDILAGARRAFERLGATAMVAEVEGVASER